MTMVANALLRMAICYEKLGKTESKGLYERVARDFPEQSAAVSEAAKHLSASRHQAGGGGIRLPCSTSAHIPAAPMAGRWLSSMTWISRSRAGLSRE